MVKTRLTGTIRRLVVASAVASAFAAGAVTPEASAHPGGSWRFPVEIQQALESRGAVLAICGGRGARRFTDRSTPNPATWLYRHFQCSIADGPTSGWRLCIHTVGRRGLVISRRMHSSRGYRPCRF